VPNYYPAIIKEDLFFQAQLGKSQRRGTGAGRKGTGFANLFSGIARCAYCRAPVLFENKGGGRKGGSYLICDTARRHRGCPSVRWRYRDFEASFLAFVEELDVASIINAASHTEKRAQLTRQIAALQGELSSVTDLMEKTYAVLDQGGPVEFVTGKLKELQARKATLSANVEAKSAEQKELLGREARYRQSKDEIKTLVRRLQGPADEETFKLRAQIASQLKVLVQTLSVAPLGSKPRLEASIERLRGTAGKEGAIAHMSQAAAHPDHSRRYIAVGFRDGDVRVVYPNAEDPLRFEQQITASDTAGFETQLPPTSADFATPAPSIG
jgi:hypothetical protein